MEIFHGGFKGIHVRTIGNRLRKKFLQVPKDSQHDYDRLTINIRTAGGHTWEDTWRKDLPLPVERVNFQVGVRAVGEFLFLIPHPQVTMARELSIVGLLNIEAVVV